MPPRDDRKDASCNNTPTTAVDAVFKPSDVVPGGTPQIRGIEFGAFRDRDMTVKDLVAGMASMGFQASAVADAVRIINDMVRAPGTPTLQMPRGSYTAREPGPIRPPVRKQPSF